MTRSKENDTPVLEKAVAVIVVVAVCICSITAIAATVRITRIQQPVNAVDQAAVAQPTAASGGGSSTPAPASQFSVTQASTVRDSSDGDAAAPATAAPATEPPVTEPPAAKAPEGFIYQPLNKKGDLYRADCTGKIWAKIVGSCYILFRDIDDPNEWGENGRVYELHVTYVRIGESYSMWSDGYWELDSTGTELTMTPKNQGENGNIGTEAGTSRTFTGKDGIFEIPITFEQGGTTTVILDLKNPLG